MVTHNLSHALTMGNRTIMLDKGRRSFWTSVSPSEGN